MLRFSINTFVNVAGDTVSQPFLNGLPLAPETTHERASHIAWDAYQRSYGSAVMMTWDGDPNVAPVEVARKGYEPVEVEPALSDPRPEPRDAPDYWTE